MPDLTPDQLGDLNATTLPAWSRGRWTEIATDLRQYHVFPNLILFKDDKGKYSRMESRPGGTAINFDLMVNHNGASSNVGMNPIDAPVNVDVMETATIPWRWSTTQYSVLQQETALNRGKMEQINSTEKTKEKASMISLAALMEANWWGPPVDSTDKVTPYGAFTWFPKSASTGFVGAFPSGFTTLGLDNEHPRWKHYVDAYTDVSATDLVRKAWLACIRTEFKNPVAGIPNLDGGLDRGLYLNTTTYVSFCEQAQRNNDNLGWDLTKGNGLTMFMNTPLMTVPKLDNDTTDPMVGLDWGTIKCIFLEDFWLKKLVIKNYPGQHLSDAFFLDSGYNFGCYNRRKNFVIAKGTTYPS